jgi:Xaa-Pro aminopeptidase
VNPRIRNLVGTFAAHGVAAILASRPTDVTYLSGFTGEDGFLLALEHEAFLLVDFRYTERAERESAGVTVTEFRGKVSETISGLAGNAGRIGFDSSHLTYGAFGRLSENLRAELVPVKSPVAGLRAVKDDEELTRIRASVKVAEESFLQLRKTMRPGMTEKDVADEVEHLLRRNGASRGAFPAIIGSAENASRPHHTVSDRVIERGDAVLIDMGAVLAGYASDLTRMVFFGEPDDEQRKVYEAVLRSQALGIEAAAAGRSGVDVDGAARGFLKDAGYGDLFGHGLGHGVGLDVHESPVLSPRSPDTLETGMVVTFEPGVYRRGWGGIRVEDMGVITESGCDLLTGLPRDIESAMAGS